MHDQLGKPFFFLCKPQLLTHFYVTECTHVVVSKELVWLFALIHIDTNGNKAQIFASQKSGGDRQNAFLTSET